MNLTLIFNYFPSWNLPMLSQFYVQDRYFPCSRTILGSSFHPQEAIDTKKVHVYSQIPNRHPTCSFGTLVSNSSHHPICRHIIKICISNTVSGNIKSSVGSKIQILTFNFFSSKAIRNKNPNGCHSIFTRQEILSLSTKQ